MNKNKKTKAYIISHAHWDREWRYPIWQTRKDLEDMFSSLIALFEKDQRYKCFVTDSQVVMLEDYLQIRPQDEQRIKALVAAGRLKIGPWYTLPEYYPIDGECIVRNLLKGDRVCRRFGEPMKIGYTTFGWGQPGQMPQIYKSFGIDVVLGGKNINASRAKNNEFIWEGADGTKMLASKLGGLGRANFFKCVVIPVVFGKENNGDNWQYDWQDKGVVFHKADIQNYWQDYHRHYRSEKDKFFKDRVKSAIDNVLQTVNGTLLKNDIILFDGGDFTAAQPLVCDIIDCANELYSDIEFVHCTLEDYAAAMDTKLDKQALSVVKGEWRDGPEPETSANALAFRSDLKRANRLAQRALINVAEPLSAIARLLGGCGDQKYLDIAWDYLLKSHCHDSLHGVVQDKTARDNAYRIEQAAELANVVADSSMKFILKNIKTGGKADDIFLVVFNTLPFERCDAVKAVIDTPAQWNARELVLVSPEGDRISAELLSVEPVKTAVNEADCRPWPFIAHRHFVEFETAAIPAMGYKCFKVEVAERMNTKIASWPNPPTKGASLINGAGVVENKYVRLSLNPNGSFDLLDKETGRLYQGLNTFEDGGDAGCGWVRYAPSSDRVYTSLTSRANSWIASDTPYSATLVTEITLELPVDCDKRTTEFDLYASRRSNITRPLTIRSEITVKRDSRRVDIVTSFTNNVTHHRLRVLFPTNLTTAEYFDVEKHFTVERKPVAPQRDGGGRYMPGMNTMPQQSFVDLSDGQCGMAVINDGLCEFEVIPDDSRAIALTLLRSVKMRICTEPRVGVEFPTQNSWAGLGDYRFRYSVLAHKGDFAAAKIYEQSQDFNVPLQLVATNTHNDGDLPKAESFFKIDGGLQLSCVKKSQDRDTTIIRVYNPLPVEASGKLHIAASIKSAYIVNMNESRLDKIEPNRDSIDIRLDANKIMTIEVEICR